MSTGSSPVCTSTLTVAFTSPVVATPAATVAACSLAGAAPSASSAAAPGPAGSGGASASSPFSSLTRLASTSSSGSGGAPPSFSRARFWLRVRRTASSDMAALTLERERERERGWFLTPGETEWQKGGREGDWEATGTSHAGRGGGGGGDDVIFGHSKTGLSDNKRRGAGRGGGGA
ncbi:hypothetical protein EYF80_053186 [Liparis tanakae]|uniref:Uncharacterized protein n=1 Tax=Liparis tanakae TaxID=230148 RepID=A0A4Z2F8N0_9TELE|nr:hypothetical protein EYF80_053186 [Liparis tanakae]